MTATTAIPEAVLTGFARNLKYTRELLHLCHAAYAAILWNTAKRFWSSVHFLHILQQSTRALRCNRESDNC